LKCQSCELHVQLGKYPFLNVRLALLSRTLSPGENLHDFVGPFLPYNLLDTVVWLAHVTSADGQVLVDMYRRVIPISMGRSIDRQDGEDIKRCVSGHFQIGAAPDTFTDRQRN
jgi:hypothetical protein